MTLDLILAIFITNFLRKSLKTAAKLPKWDKIFMYMSYAAIAMLVAELTISRSRVGISWLSHFLMLYLIYVLYKEEELIGARQVLFAIAPYVLLSLFSDITRLADAVKYSGWEDLIDIATVFSVVWMVAMLIIINKQKKALEKERIKTHAEEEKKKEVISLKDQLEIQVAQRTAELTQQKEELQQTLVELKATQAQLIQSEKMASLGELTAGIAHEIQNPLNFVNNFAEVNAELATEIQEEIEKGNFEEVRSIAKDLRENEEKISYHGKRADAIVKGMLQHSRKNTEQKELTDINALTEEYLRLSYHGLRAKDKSFNATMETHFDPDAKSINVVQQDIGRVLLNIFNNAFYAVTEKKKFAGEDYEPTIYVATKKINNEIEIKIRDNGNGVPPKVLEKIFQPFFTTKPTGQGTGLGLSISYDIIKSHGGEIKVDGQDGKYTEFIIALPI
jgi:two-component system, NtrC family, sensor kinase